GYATGDNITVAFGTNATIQQAVASTNGSFTTSFTVDVQAYGTTTITAGGISSANNRFFIIPQVVSVIPATGSVGTIVTIYSTGYAAGDNITVAFGTNATIQTAVASTQGSFTTSFTVDVQQYGTTTIIASGISSADNRFFIFPQVVSVTPTQGSVGTIVTMDSTGYAASDTVTVSFGTNNNIQQAKASANGSLTCSFTVDVQAYGTTTITAGGVASAGNRFFITPQVVSVLPTSGSVGTIVTIYSTGYAAGEVVTVNFGTNNNIQQAQASTYGSFTTSWTVDVQKYGTTTIIASGVSVAMNTFYIEPEMYSVIPTAGTVGSLVTVSGQGYQAGEMVSIDFGRTTSITSSTVESNGAFVAVLTVDTQPQGTRTIVATGASSGLISRNRFVIIGEIIGITPAQATVGSIITVSGTGYGVGQEITVDFGLTNAITNGYPQADGVFNIPFTVDTQVLGTTTVVARSASCYDTTNIYILPAIYNIEPKTGSVGTMINVFGNGYAGGDKVYISFGKTNDIKLVKSQDVSQMGSFATTFVVDIQPSGTVTIIGRSNTSGLSGTYQFRICGEITQVTPIIGSVGTPVSVTGNGYGANENIRIDFGAANTRTIATANSDGVFNTIFTVDTQVAGTKTIVAIGMATGDTDDRPFRIFANIIEITPTEGYATIVINVKGNGYAGNEQVKIDFGKTMSLVSCLSDEYGSFDITFTTDTQPMGSNTVSATGMSSNEYAYTYFAIVPQIVIVTPTKGSVGTMVSIEGRGYQANEGVRIDFGWNYGITQTTALANGVFKATFVVNTQEYGITEIGAYGLISNVRPIKDFTIVSNVVQVTPSRGSVGTMVNVLGTGYGNAEPIRVDFGTTTSMAIVTSSTYGKVLSNFTIDTQSCGTKTVAISGLESGELSSSRFVIFSNIVSMTPIKATVGTPITLIGNGYGDTEPIDVNLGKTLPITTVMTDGGGVFTLVFTVDTQKCGTTTVEAIGRISGESSNSGVNIYANIWSSIWQVTPNSGTVGTIVTVSGNGFDELEMIRVDFGISRSMCEKVTSENGSFTIVFTVNTQPAGNVRILAEGLDSGQIAEAIFVITGKVFVTPTSGTVGRVVRVYGEGFSNKEPIKVDFGITPSVAGILTSSNGTFSTTFTIDTQVYGTTTVLVRETKANGISAETTLYIRGNVIMVTPNKGTVGAMITVSGNGYGVGEQLLLEFGSTSITPTRATVGTPIYIMGTGFTASENIRMRLGINAAIIQPNTVYASSYGSFATTFTVDAQPAGSTQIFVYSYPSAQTSENPKAYSSMVIYSNITAVTPSKGTVGSFVTVYGNGYGLSEAIKVDFGKKASMSQVTANVIGEIVSIFTVDTQAYGTTTVIANGLSTGEVAAGLYCIKANIILTSPTKGTVGTIITLAGNGYGDNTGEFIQIDFGTTPSIGMIKANSSGEFITTFTIDTQVRGPTTITAQGLTTGEKVYSSVTIYANITTLTPTRGSVGMIITLVANGYNPTEQMKIDFGATVEIIDIYTDITGAFSTTFTVNTQVSGTKTVVVIGRTSLERDTRLFYLHAAIAQSTPMAGTIGTPITINGTGFGRRDQIRVDFGTTNAIISPLPITEEDGTFIYTFTADAQVNGPNRILATDMENNEKGYATFTAQVHVTTFKPTFGSVGTIVTIIGDGYSGSETVRISLGINKTITTVTSNAAGEFTTTFTVDTQSGGTASVIAYGLNCQQDELRRFEILTNIVVVSPGQGTVGTPILVIGNGYWAGEGIRVDFGKVITMTSVTTDNRGYFEASFTIDTQTFGTTTITAAGLVSQTSAEKTLLVRSNIILVTPTRATVGTIITVAGNGYSGSENIRIDFGYTRTIGQVLTNATGEFNTSWTLDTQPCGTTTIVATGLVSGEVSRAALCIYSNIITVSPFRGSVGTTITVQGTGYGATEPIAIDLGWTKTRSTTVTDYSGYFATTLTINVQPCGTTTVVARGVRSGEVDDDRLVIFSNIYEVSPVWGMVGEL
ncbi:hypothetical protein HY792_03090, partial [Candidatus Desantisbacteria bacterium]|nr:hypothetical protein [Candidatus Desantisbacteria bacterium]